MGKGKPERPWNFAISFSRLRESFGFSVGIKKD